MSPTTFCKDNRKKIQQLSFIDICKQSIRNNPDGNEFAISRSHSADFMATETCQTGAISI